MEALIIIFFVVLFLAVLGVAGFSSPDDEREQVSGQAETASGDLHKVKVRHIIDGDTVIVSKSWSEIRVRLSAIDCPEDGQHWGNVAKAGLIKLIGGRHVHIETHGIDAHGRTLATIYVNFGSKLINVNERMVMLGHAWVMRQYWDHLPKSRQYQLNRLEQWARSKRVGLWKTDNPIPPWRWRKQSQSR